MSEGINIASGAGGLGSALTNPTALAVKKGKLKLEYPVEYMGNIYTDAETAYKNHKQEGNEEFNDRLMVEIICNKFAAHKNLYDEVRSRGGLEFLEQCSHFVGARTARGRSWEGQGMKSRFIRNLVAGYRKYDEGWNK